MPNPKRTEKDPDELVHEQQVKIPGELTEQDVDDLVHQQPASAAVDETGEIDVDDLLHEGDEGERVILTAKAQSR